jgi:hypothetical protein
MMNSNKSKKRREEVNAAEVVVEEVASEVEIEPIEEIKVENRENTEVEETELKIREI